MRQDRKPLLAAEKHAQKRRVCVTGATGYLAGSVIARLLAAGHEVHATCRNLSAETKLENLKVSICSSTHLSHTLWILSQKLPGARDRLQLFEADLEIDGSFAEAIQGCHCVLHLASVFRLRVPKGKERELLIHPAVHGVSNLLKSVNNTPSVERVVLTSSVAAIVGKYNERCPNHVFTEEDWNLSSTEHYLPYHYSKKVAELKAWELSRQQQRWSLVVLNPGMIFGPPLTNTKCESIKFVRQQLNGTYRGWMAAIGFGIVDIDDVAAAHCLAMIQRNANGRIVAILRRKWSGFSLPYFQAPFWLIWIVSFFFKGLDVDLFAAIWAPPPKFDNSRSQRELGLTYLPSEDTFNDMVEWMIEHGIAKPAK